MRVDDRRLSELWAKGLSASQIATRLGTTVSGVHQALKRLGVAGVGPKTSSQAGSSVRSV